MRLLSNDRHHSVARWGPILLTLLVASGCHAPGTEDVGQGPPLVATGEVTVMARAENIPTYPCSRCHDERLPPNPKERPLELHARVELRHMQTDRWCYTCHSQKNIDRLQLPNGKLIEFDESYRLCGACHGEKLRDWEANIHGLTTGYWNGPKKKRSCTACHSPHEPPFPNMEPLPPPNRPRTVEDT